MSQVLVAIFMGSASDEASVAPAVDVLKQLGIGFTIAITSAHRTPERTEALIAQCEEQGCQVYICAAGMAAHLAGAVAARTCKPVVGIPLSNPALGGLDALLSTVQMPPGFPVGTVALDKAGAKNAAWFAAQILALNNPALTKKLQLHRQSAKAEVEKTSNSLASKYQNECGNS